MKDDKLIDVARQDREHDEIINRQDREHDEIINRQIETLVREEINAMDEYKQMKAFFECHQADKNHYDEWIEENKKTELDRAAEEYSGRYCLEFQRVTKESFVKGTEWLISKWNNFIKSGYSEFAANSFTDFINKECK